MRTALESAKVWISALAIAAPAAAWGQSPAAAQTPATSQQTAPIDRYVVGQARPPENPKMPTVDMTLEQAIERALEKNLDLRAARLQPRTLDFQLQSIRASYTPTFTSSYNYSNAARRSENTLHGVDRVATNDQGYHGHRSINPSRSTREK